MANLRVVPGTGEGLLSTTASQVLEALDLLPQDALAARLAIQYVRLISMHQDDPVIVGRLGPKLLDALDALGATPAARARLKGGPGTDAPTQLQALRSARR